VRATVARTDRYRYGFVQAIALVPVRPGRKFCWGSGPSPNFELAVP